MQYWTILKDTYSVNVHVVKTLMVNYDTPRQHLNVNWVDF